MYLGSIIIDGLDECERPKDLVDLFRDIGRHNNVRILFLARQDHELEHFAMQDIPGLQMLDIINYNNRDILSFIETKVSELAHINTFVAADASSVVEQILRDARGMFQWVNLVLYQLRQVKSKDHLFKQMRSFPKELNEAYAKTFHRLSQTPAFELDILSLVLKLLTVSYRSLSWDDLAMAVQLQKELDCRRRQYHRRRLDPQSIQQCIDTAVGKIAELPDDYFAFLGPLIDIRPTTTTTSSTSDDAPTTRPPRMVALCHHSLYQWIEGTEQRVDHATPGWKEIHFSRSQAHGALAGLTLAMMTSTTMLGAHLQYLYRYTRCPVPFLNYSGEFWFAHLRAVGGSAGFALLTAAVDGQFPVEAEPVPMSLADLSRMVLANNMDMAAGVCAALSAALGAVSIDKVRGLPKVMALRGLQLALLPASEGVASVKKALPELVHATEEFHASHQASRHLHVGGEEEKEEEEDLFVHGVEGSKSLGPKLDSETALHVLHLTKRWVDNDSSTWKRLSGSGGGPPLKQRIALLCQGARDIRRLAILLAVDPVRGWIYAQTGETGISPLAALAFASEAIDTYLAASFLSPETFKSYDMAGQFTTQAGHPYHGLVSAASYELATQNYNGFNSEFYRENIMEHYRISQWEWSTIRFLLAAMEMAPPSGSFYPNAFRMHATLEGWVANHNLFSVDSDGNRRQFMAPVDIVGAVPFRKLSTRAAISVKQSLGLITRATAAFLFKYVTYICPPLENTLLNMQDQFLFIAGTIQPTIRYLVINWKDFFVAFGFYLLRCRYFPWLFGYSRTTPWADLKGVLADPEGYIPVASSPYGYGYIPMILFFVQYGIIILLTISDTAKLVFDSKTGKLVPESLKRRTSFKLGWTSDSAPAFLRKIERAVETYGFHWFSSFRRIILIEMVVLNCSYWVFDLIRSSAHAVTSALWSWQSALTYALQLVGYVYGRTAGFVNAGKLYLRVLFWIYLLGKYRDSSAAGYAFRWVVLPTCHYFLGVFQGVILAVAARWDAFLSGLDTLEGFVLQGIRQIAPRTLIFSTAIATPILGCLFWYIFSDPLALESAAQSRERAGKISKEIAGIENPAKFLKWNGPNRSGLDPAGVIAFTGELKDLEKEI